MIPGIDSYHSHKVFCLNCGFKRMISEEMFELLVNKIDGVCTACGFKSLIANLSAKDDQRFD